MKTRRKERERERRKERERYVNKKERRKMEYTIRMSGEWDERDTAKECLMSTS